MNNTEKLVFGFLGITIIIAIFAIFSAFNINPFSANPATSIAQNAMGQKITRMNLSAFDVGLAKQFMDKDGDGKCDACGMPVELCIDSGQLQCNMDSKSTMGLLGSQHAHADWKIYVDGKALDERFFDSIAMNMSNAGNGLTSSFIHVDRGAPAPEKTGDVLHMHATGIPLWVFFESVGMAFNRECLELSAAEKYCNTAEKTVKFFVNGKPDSEFEKYVFKDGDKLLISYGAEKESAIQEQVSSITDFGKNH